MHAACAKFFPGHCTWPEGSAERASRHASAPEKLRASSRSTEKSAQPRMESGWLRHIKSLAKDFKKSNNHQHVVASRTNPARHTATLLLSTKFLHTKARGIPEEGKNEASVFSGLQKGRNHIECLVGGGGEGLVCPHFIPTYFCWCP